MDFLTILRPLLEKHEGYLPRPVWDHKQWSIGYGTAIGFDINKKPNVTYTRNKAWEEAYKNIKYHFDGLKKVIKVNLNPNQWAALISFSYNTGLENGKKMAGYVNQKDTALLSSKWNKYVYASGKILQGLVNRRKEEYKLFSTPFKSTAKTLNPMLLTGVVIATIFILV